MPRVSDLVLWPQVARVRKAMRRGPMRGSRISAGAPVYLTAALEYLTAEVLELAGHVAHDLRRGRISPRHISLAVRTDPELDRLFAAVVLPAAGVVPHIQPELLAAGRRGGAGGGGKTGKEGKEATGK
eukprot:XP_001691141.1 histone H2A variant [Chlamydomonas reinhardtii]